MQYRTRTLFEIITLISIALACVVAWKLPGAIIATAIVCAWLALLHHKIEWAWFVFYCMTAVLLLIAPALIPRPVGARRADCANKLRQIALALEMYCQNHGTYPPAYTVDNDGNRLHSWRTLILPYLEGTNVYNAIRFDEPWDSAYNSQFHVRLPIYMCPSQSSQNHKCFTPYLAITGPGTAWPGSVGLDPKTISDGRIQTILLVEAHDANVKWMEPRDLEISTMSLTINQKTPKGPPSQQRKIKSAGISSRHLEGANVAFFDMHVGFLWEQTSSRRLQALITPNGNDNAGRR
jgi:prepilin-type processing-associated H-X9-DG protein